MTTALAETLDAELRLGLRRAIDARVRERVDPAEIARDNRLEAWTHRKSTRRSEFIRPSSDDPAAMLEYLLARLSTRARRECYRGPLTNRQHAVLAGLSTGRTYAEIATALGVSANNMGEYAKRACERLDVETPLQALRVARRLGLLD